jgi:hypothetical protein
MNPKTMVTIAIALMATGLIASLILSRPWIAFRTVEPLRVTGYAEIPVEADIAVMEAQVTVTGNSTKFAYERAAEDLEIIRGMIPTDPAQGWKTKELQSSISDVRVRDKDGKYTNVIDYYVVRRRLKIESQDVRTIESLSREIFDLNAEGMRVEVTGPRYLISDLGDTKLDLVKAATENAMQRAKTIARNAKANLGNLVSARQGVVQITQPNSTDTSSYGRYDTTTIEKVAKITVHLEIGIR